MFSGKQPARLFEPQWLYYRIQQIEFSVVDQLEYQLAEQGVLPGEPRPCEVRCVVARERFVHETRSGVDGHKLYDAVADLGVVGRGEGPHHDAHGPDHFDPDVRTADSLACGTLPKIRIFAAPDKPAGVFVNRVGALRVAQVGHGQQRGHVGVVHELHAAEAVDLERVDFAELGMLHDGMPLQGGGHLVGQGGALAGQRRLVIDRPQDFGRLAQ